MPLLMVPTTSPPAIIAPPASKNGGDDDRAGQGDGMGTDRRADIVGDVVCADIHRHVAADHGRGYQEDTVDTPIGPNDCKKHDPHNKDQRGPKAEQFIAISLSGRFDVLGS